MSDQDISKQMFFTLLPLMFICFGTVLYYMVALNQIEVTALTPDYLETYRCE